MRLLTGLVLGGKAGYEATDRAGSEREGLVRGY